MNTRFFNLLLAAILLAVHTSRADTAPAHPAADGKTNVVKSAEAGSETNRGPKLLPIPVSVFEASPSIHDPFFPESIRLHANTVSNTAVPVFSPSNLKLKALFGSANHRLAMINNHTFCSGEKAELITLNGKLMVYCDEVKENSVMIHTDSQLQPIEIFISKGVR